MKMWGAVMTNCIDKSAPGSVDDVTVPDKIDGIPLQDCPFCGHKVEKPLAKTTLSKRSRRL